MTGRLLNGARWLIWSTPHGCAQWGERVHGRVVVVTKEGLLGGQERLGEGSKAAEANGCRWRRVRSSQWYGCAWCWSIDRGEGVWARFSRTGPAWWAEGRRREVAREGTEGQWELKGGDVGSAWVGRGLCAGVGWSVEGEGGR